MKKNTCSFSPRLLVFIGVIALLSINICAQDAQWRGPDRNGVYPDTALLTSWPEEGPDTLFVTEGLGRGYASAVATDNRIFTTGTIDSTEYLTAMDHQGRIIWSKPYGKSWEKSFPDSRSTPTVEDDRVYVLSGLDDLACLHAETGEIIWKVDLHQAYQSSWDMFGVSESVLIVDDKIITTPGGDLAMVVALDKLTGELIWQSESIGMKRANMSPVLIERSGKKYVITASQTHLLGVDVDSGEILWRLHYNFLTDKEENTTILANSPIYKDSCLWVSNGWDTKSIMLEVSADGHSVTERFADHTFDNQNHGVVLVDGFLYGSNFTGRNSGKWVCMNWNTGEITWIADFHNKGPIISADGMLYCLEEKRGHLALVKAGPEAFEVVSSFRVAQGKGPFWARPTIYFGKLLVRHGDVLIAYDIKE